LKPLIHIHDLSLSISHGSSKVAILKSLNLDVNTNEILGLIGRSGSGKSMLASVMMHLYEPPEVDVTGQLIYYVNDEKLDLLSQSAAVINEYRRTHTSVVFQNPVTALNPRMTCGHQIMEAIQIRRGKRSKTNRKELLDMLQLVEMDEPERIASSYPHELSGGQLQRVVIAMALAKSPKLLIADELTSSLDKTTEREIIKLLLKLKREVDLSILFISHDLVLVQQISQRIAIIDHGEIIHTGHAGDLSSSNHHSIIKQLLSSRLSRLPEVSRQAPLGDELLRISSVSKTYRLSHSLFKKAERITALDDITTTIYASEIVGIVGESGSGKSTLAKLLVGLEKADSGAISLQGRDVWNAWSWHRRSTSRLIQIVFQNPYQSLNPKQTTSDGIKELLLAHGSPRAGIMHRIEELLLEVGLSAEYLHRYPSQMSGGQQQRVCIAKALAVRPSILICDECVAALDSVSKLEILQLLLKLNQERKLTVIFISHDIESVMAISRRILVLQKARFVYTGDIDGLYSSDNQYIRALLGQDD